MKKPRPQQGSPKTALLGDLESIRTLLDEEAAAEASASRSRDDAEASASRSRDDADASASRSRDDDDTQDVPLLDDVVEGAMRLDETLFDKSPSFDPAATGGMDDELFQALLGDSWKQSAGRILERTRATIEEHRNDWAPQDTDELNEALKERIDATLRRWLKRLVLAHIDELRSELLQAAGAALTDEVNRRLAKDPDKRIDPTAPNRAKHNPRNLNPDKKA